MPRWHNPFHRRATLTVSALVLVVGVVAAVAMAAARNPTLQVARHAPVTNLAAKTTVTEAIVTNSHGRAVYDLTGDRRGHAECTKANSCFSIWPPVKVSSPRKLTKAAGIKGKLGTWHRNGFFQVTLNGHPLYAFSVDRHPRAATGEGIHGFSGTWHVLRPAGSSAKPVNQPPMTTSTTSMTSTSTTPCLYPPC
jgi:predicted lipoprotein with Yx(FWY)xxD motif